MSLAVDYSPLLLQTVQEVRQHIRQCRQQQSTAADGDGQQCCVKLVPTMGALHEGHMELVRRARLEASSSSSSPLVLVSIFVNPLQFGPAEDFGRYPRTLADDLTKLRGLADCVFAPAPEEILGCPETKEDEDISVNAGWIGRLLEGQSRPNYFGGVLTIVAKLFNIVQPDVALFGQKDAQQLFAIQQMVKCLNFPVRVVPVETAREPDGLAMSSRNRYLNPADRRTALCLWKTLKAAQMEAEKGAELGQAMAVARQTFEAEAANGNCRLDYLVAVDKATFKPVQEAHTQQSSARFRGQALLLMASFVGDTRLIDNLELHIGGKEATTTE